MDMSIGFQKLSSTVISLEFKIWPRFWSSLLTIKNGRPWPSDLKEIVRGACDAAMTRSLTRWALDDAKVIKMLKDEGKVNVTKFSKEVQQEILDKFVAHYDAIQDPMFQKVWKSQKEFIKIYVPYMRLQQVDAEVKLK